MTFKAELGDKRAMGFLHDLYGARGRALPDRSVPYIIGDKSAYMSPMDRTVVDGRTAHKEHMKRHGVIEAGDMVPSNTVSEPQGIRDDIKRAVQEVASR